MFMAPTLDQLINTLADGDYTARHVAREQIRYHLPGAVPTLIDVMQAHKGRASWEVASILVDVDDPRVTEAMCRALHSRNPIMTQYAVNALQRVGGPHVERALVEALPNVPYMTQFQIIGAVEHLRIHQALPLLLDLMSGEAEGTFRLAIIQALGYLGDAGTLPLLNRCLDDENAHIRKRSRIAIDRIMARQGERYSSSNSSH